MDAITPETGELAAARARIDLMLTDIDHALSAQLDAILHHPRFQRLEGRWRGLDWLLRELPPGRSLKVVVLSASWVELDRDIARRTEFDQSNVFRLIYEDEFGHPGGEPFGLLVVDEEVRHRPEPRFTLAHEAPVDDVSALNSLAAIGAAAFVPIVVGASPALLGVDHFEDLALSNNLAATFAGADYARWRALAGREETRFLCVTMPRILARPRWAADPSCAWFKEYAPTSAERTWFVAGYVFAAVVGRAFLAHGWPADVRGVTTDRVGGGLVLNLPKDDFKFGAVTSWPRAALDLSFTDRQERDLVLAGLMPLNALPFGDTAFASVHSLHSPSDEIPGGPASAYQANRRISAQISAMLCVSRFAHYIKMIGRELTGSFLRADEIQRRLQNWLATYTNISESASPESRARFPLLSSAVQVHEIAGRSGAFGCVVHLRPYYQLDDIATTFRLVTNFAASGTPGALAGQEIS